MCGLECFQNADISGCTSECVEDQAGLSSDCSDCFGELTACTTDNCLAQCLEDSAAPECIECQEEFCADDFESCSGIPVN
jgi:hypothetical protein